MHGPFSASLCSTDRELTPRVPVVFDGDGEPLWHFVGHTCEDGVGDRLTIWCAGCGARVGHRKLLKLVSIDGGVGEAFDLPLVSMLRERAEA